MRHILSEVSTQVARRCSAQVVEEVQPSTYQMSEAAIRGYVRAVARDRVEREAAAATSQYEWGVFLRGDVVAQALDTLASQISRELADVHAAAVTCQGPPASGRDAA